MSNRDSRVITINLPSELVDMVDRYVVRNGVSRGAIIEASIISFADAWRRSQLAVVDGEK